MNKLRVIPTEKAMVPNYEAAAGGVMRFVGWKHDAAAGVNGGFVMSSEAVEVPFRAEYLQEIKAGNLQPADESTAKIAGVPFAKV